MIMSDAVTSLSGGYCTLMQQHYMFQGAFVQYLAQIHLHHSEDSNKCICFLMETKSTPVMHNLSKLFIGFCSDTVRSELSSGYCTAML